MKRICLIVLSTAFLISCSGNQIDKDNEAGDLPRFLLEKSVGPLTDVSGNIISDVQDTIYYSYDKNGVVSGVENSLWKKTYSKGYFRNDINTPYIMEHLYDKQNNRSYTNEYFVTTDGRVMSANKKITGFINPMIDETEYYTYNHAGMLQGSKVSTPYGFFRETNYQYHSNSSVSVKRWYTIRPNQSMEQVYELLKSEDKYYSGHIKPKSRIIYPFNYGVEDENVLVRIVRTDKGATVYESEFSYILDDNGLITESEMKENGKVNTFRYFYRKL